MTETIAMIESPLKVVIADDHNLLRHAVRDIIETRPQYQIIGEASTAEEAIKLVEQERPDILILDIGLPQRSGIDVILEIRAKKIPTKIVVLSMYDDEMTVRKAFSSGSDGYLLKHFSPEEFLMALKSVTEGKRFLPEQFSHLLTEVPSKPANGKSSNGHNSTDPLEVLSPREREMFFLLVEGLPNRVIAKKLFISPRTVETHRARVIKKLQLSSNADLIRYAIKHGLVVV